MTLFCNSLTRDLSFSAIFLLSVTTLAAQVAVADETPAAGNNRTGSLSGRVTLDGNPVPPRKIVINKDVKVCDQAPREVQDLKMSDDGEGVIGAVIEIQGVDPPENGEWQWQIPEEGYVLRQKGCNFEPSLVVMPSEAKLTVHNDDEVTHNANTGQWNFMQAQGAEAVEKIVTGRSPIRVTCNIHSWMEAWIYPARSPFFAVTDDEGQYSIDGVPAGKYRVVVWHPALGRERLRVEINAGEASRLEVAIRSPN